MQHIVNNRMPVPRSFGVDRSSVTWCDRLACVLVSSSAPSSLFLLFLAYRPSPLAASVTQSALIFSVVSGGCCNIACSTLSRVARSLLFSRKYLLHMDRRLLTDTIAKARSLISVSAGMLLLLRTVFLDNGGGECLSCVSCYLLISTSSGHPC